MTAITWVLAADDKRARIFETQGLKLDLQQVEDIKNASAQATEPGDKDRETFAKALAMFLEQSRLHHRFNRLRLAVEPRFLSVLLEHLSSETRKLVYESPGNDTRSLQRHVGQA